MMNNNIEFSSYKDSSAQVFYKNNEVFRKIFKNYIPVFEKFVKSGLYEKLLEKKLILPFEIIEKTD